MNKCIWPIGSGNDIAFYIYPLDTAWTDREGLYIYSYQNQGVWCPLYIGQTDSFKNTVAYHELYFDALERGMTHIHACPVAHKGERFQLLRAFLYQYQPILNYTENAL